MSAVTHRVSLPYLAEPAYHTQFDNGYQLIFVPKRGEVFNVSTWVKTGSIHENPQNNGVSHFLEHLMFKGTERFAPGEFDKAMESMGAIINAATWKDFTFYYITGPSGSQNRNFAKALDMHADMLLCSTLPEAEVGEQHDWQDANSSAKKRERGVVIEEIGMREDQPWTKVYNALNRMMYPEGHPYRRDVIGTRDIISQIDRADIMEYYRQWYSAGTMTTIVVGDFEPQWLEQAVLKAFDFSKQTAAKQPGVVVDEASRETAAATRFELLEGDYQTTFFITGFHGPRADDLQTTIALDVASLVLGEGRSSRLYQAFIEKPEAPVFNTISCGQSTFKLGNVFFIQGNLNDTNAQAHMDAVIAELETFLRNEPITEAEFKRAVRKLKVDFAETSETASGIAETLGEAMTVAGSLDTYAQYLAVLESLTREQVQETAVRWFNPQNAYTAVLVPKGGV